MAWSRSSNAHGSRNLNPNGNASGHARLINSRDLHDQLNHSPAGGQQGPEHQLRLWNSKQVSTPFNKQQRR
nr:hypothetical protein Iba_chr07cCG6350 [Ipomoea batatas]